MTADLRELLRDAADEPGSTPDFTGMAQRARRRRRMLGVAVASVVAIVVAAGAVFVAGNDGSENRTEVAIGTRDGRATPEGWTRIDLGNDLSIAVPPDWERFTLSDPTGPFVAGLGTTEPAVDQVVTACSNPTAPYVVGTWLSIYEFPAASPGAEIALPEGESTNIDSFHDRPAVFSAIPNPGGSCAASDGSGKSFAMYLFADHGRLFDVRIVTTAQPNATGLAKGVEVLNTFTVGDHDAPSPTVVAPDGSTTTLPSPSSSATTARSPAVDDQTAIRAAYLGWLGATERTDISAYIEDAASIMDAHRQGLAQKTPAELAAYNGTVDAITMVDATHADVTYSVIFDGRPQYPGQAGRAVKINGRWYVTRETYCALLTNGGITCPLRTTPVP